MSRLLLLLSAFALSCHGGLAVAKSGTSAPVGQTQTRSVLAYLAGTEIVVTAIDSSDGFSAFSADFIGKPMVVASSGAGKMVSSDGGTWWGGPATLVSTGQTVSFTKVAVTSTSTPVVQYDTTPDLFTLKAVTNVIPGTAVTSDAITVKGIEADVAISISGGEYSIDGGTFTSAADKVSLGQSVVVRVTASTTLGATASATLTIGGISSSFGVTTMTTAGDYTPNPFSFTAVSNASPSQVVKSNTITVQGIDIAVPISVSGGEYSINGGAWTANRGTVTLGSQVEVRQTAPSAYNHTGTATLTIGDVSADFSVTTRTIVPVTNVTEVFSNAGTSATVSNGVVSITATPTAPLQLTTTALQNAVVTLDTAGQIPVQSGSNVINLTRQTDSTAMLVATVGGSPALVPITGSVGISAPTSGTSIPLTGSSTGSASAQTTTDNTSLIAGPSTDTPGNFIVAVGSGGRVTYQASGRGRSVPSSFDVYPGEAVVADEAGTAGQVRLGSFGQDGLQAGDYLANLPHAASTLNVPIVTGTSSRFSSDWATLVGRAIAAKFSLGTFESLSQNSASGMLTLVTDTGTYRFLPVGTLALADAALTGAGGGSRTVSVGSVAANLTNILDSNLAFAVAPATSYADLATALKHIDSSASLEILGDGVLKASLGGTDYIAQPASATVAGNVTANICPGFDTVANQLALCDSNGTRQVLYAAFADTDTLRSTFRTDLGLPQLSVTNTGSAGAYTAVVGSATYTLNPDITLSTPPAAQAGKLWWSEGGKIYIRYPNGAAQGFSLQ
jgi:hypothetical protein